MSSLAGKRILIVEDEFLVALVAETALTDRGVVAVGPAGAPQEALRLIAAEKLDAAILDLNLNGARSDAVAEALRAAGVPFLVATGYGASDSARAFGAPILEKPYSEEQLAEAVERLLEA